MIFVCLGTQIFQMNRLLVELDRLIEKGVITEPVFAQIGKSDYRPKHYEYRDFIDPEEYQRRVDEADLIITHGGTGAIVKALKSGKQMIAVPRLFCYHEHENDHQLQIVDFFASQGYLLKAQEMDELEGAILELRIHPITKRFVGDGCVGELIDDFIDRNERDRKQRQKQKQKEQRQRQKQGKSLKLRFWNCK